MSGGGGEFLDIFFFYIRYSTLLHLPPLRFHCVAGCCIEPRTVATATLAVRRSKHSARSHPHSARSHPRVSPGTQDEDYLRSCKCLVPWQLADALLTPCKCYFSDSGYILQCISCVFMYVHVTCALGKPCREHSPLVVHSQMFRIAINKLFEWLFSRVLASHRGCPVSIPGRDMPVLSPYF